MAPIAIVSIVHNNTIAAVAVICILKTDKMKKKKILQCTFYDERSIKTTTN